MPVTLILGGARSGKSQRAEALARASNAEVLYIATGPYIEGDDEWAARIAHHRHQRPAAWRTIEEPLALVERLQSEAAVSRLLLVDCLTLWLSNLLVAGRDAEAEGRRLCRLLPELPGEVLLVSNEVGMGLVPEHALSRNFRDAQGRLNQAVAAVADRVEFVAAGLPLHLK
jgi:adenosylcobinamide kinase/adenosylcobinamide-phosphate guanylyltransferase